MSIRETTVSAKYHDEMARTLIDLVRDGKLRAFPHEGLQKQLTSVVLKRSQAASRDDSSVKVKIDSGSGAGVAGKDDLVVALAGASFEATTRPDYQYALAVLADKSGPPTSSFVQRMRQRKSRALAKQMQDAERRRTDEPQGDESYTANW